MKYLIDSNIIIYHLNGDRIATDFISLNIAQSAISRITYIEILSFDYNEKEEENIKNLLNMFTIIDTNKDIALQAIKNIKKVKIKVPDNIIASTSQVYDLILITRNTKDFLSLDVKLLNVFEKK